MLPTIGHIGFHAKLVAVSAAISEELRLEIAGIEVVLPSPLDEAEIVAGAEKLAKTCDIIITRADTVDLLSLRIKTPVIARSASFPDVLDALASARQLGTHMALVLHHSQDFDLGSWPQTLGIQVKKFLFTSLSDVRRAVTQALSENFDLIVGGTLAGSHATSLGMKHYLIEAKKDSIIQSVRKAIDVYKAIQKEKEYTANFQSLLDFANEGVIFLNDTDLVTYLNARAYQLLQVKRQTLLHQRLLQVSEDILSSETVSNLTRILNSDSSEPFLGLLLHLKTVGTLVANINFASIEENNIHTIITFTEASALQKAEHKVRQQLSAKGFVARFSLEDIIGKSRVLEQAKEQARSFARTNSTILLDGETGTGKELFAHSIHKLSARANGPFVAVNSCALPKDLLESELFGYEEGAFTGAKKTGKPGLLEIAHGGTLFIDEIGTMPLDLQAKLLRVIQEKEVVRLGGTNVIPINLRIIAATNRSLAAAVRNGEFRQDLYYRLNVLLLRIPPLRQRPEDIPLLFLQFISKIASEMNVPLVKPDQDELLELATHSWPGNIRELENFAERYVAMATYVSSSSGLLNQLLFEVKGDFTYDRFSSSSSFAHNYSGLSESVILAEREILVAAGKKFNWNRQKMAQELAVSPVTLWRKLKKAGLLVSRASDL